MTNCPGLAVIISHQLCRLIQGCCFFFFTAVKWAASDNWQVSFTVKVSWPLNYLPGNSLVLSCRFGGTVADMSHPVLTDCPLWINDGLCVQRSMTEIAAQLTCYCFHLSLVSTAGSCRLFTQFHLNKSLVYETINTAVCALFNLENIWGMVIFASKFAFASKKQFKSWRCDICRGLCQTLMFYSHLESKICKPGHLFSTTFHTLSCCFLSYILHIKM